MTKGNSLFIKEAIDEWMYQLKDGYHYYLEDYDLYGTTCQKNLFKTDNKQYIHVYYNDVNVEREKIIINQIFNKMDKQLEDRKEKIIKRKEDVAAFGKYYKLEFDENGYFQNYKRKEIKKLIEQAGFFTIITSTKMKASEALEIYRNRDAVEKVFRMEKSYLGNDVFRVHLDEHL